MFSSHVARQLSAYYHEELPSVESRRVAEHLIGCPRCRAEFEQIKLGGKLAERMPLPTAPDSLWTGIENALDNRHQENTNVLRRRSRLKPLAIAAGFALLFIGSVVFVRFFRNQPGSEPSWEVARLAGMPRIGSIFFGDKGRLAVGQWLETDSSSRARIAVSNIGQVEIDSNTRIRLVETRATEHRLELARGRMRARISAPPKLFFVDTPSAVAEDLGCAYTLEVDDAGNSLLRVTAGWVSLQLKDRESAVPAGAACATRPGIGPGTPYFEDASERFRTALTRVDFEPNNARGSLNIVLAEARPRDAMTLWYLLSRVMESERGRVYDRLATLAPPPAGVTRAGVLSLSPEMLQRWRDAIERARGRLPAGPFEKGLKRFWTSTLGRVHKLEGKK